jgi:hypothetical protein
MAYISQASATVSNSSKLTLSVRVQFTSDDDYIPMLEFGSSLGENGDYWTTSAADPLGAFRACRIFKQKLRRAADDFRSSFWRARFVYER